MGWFTWDGCVGGDIRLCLTTNARYQSGYQQKHYNTLDLQHYNTLDLNKSTFNNCYNIIDYNPLLMSVREKRSPENLKVNLILDCIFVA